MRDKQKIQAAIIEGIVEPYQSALLQLITPSVQLQTTGKPAATIGESKLGGLPDLADGMTWAFDEEEQEYLSFLGQVNLADIVPFGINNLLPKQGILYFFFDLNDCNESKVLYSTAVETVKQVSCPTTWQKKGTSRWQRFWEYKNGNKVLRENSIDMYITYSTPIIDSLQFCMFEKENELTYSRKKVFKKNCKLWEEDNITNHRFGGHYRGIQSEFHQLDCLSFDTATDYIHFNAITLDKMKEALQWKLLFQFDSDSLLDVNIADCGRLYFFIHEDDLKNHIFDHVQMTWDCY